VPDSVHLWAPSFASFGGGITAFSRALASALSADRSVRLIGKMDRAGSWNGLSIHGSGGATGHLQTSLFAATLLSLAVRRRPRIIISTHINFGPVAHALKRALGIPFVLVAHGVEIGPHLSAARLRALRSARAIWSVSRWTRERLLAIGVSGERSHILPNTVSSARFDIGPPAAELRAVHGLDGHAKVILTVARLVRQEAYKGCDRVLMALPTILQTVGSLRYLIVGSGDDVGRLRTLAVSLGVERHVTFCGFVPEGELPAYYRLADAFAMPSTGEGFGVAFLEALASGVPVLGGDRDGTSDALADGELGLLVDPGSVGEIAAGLIRLLKREGPPLWFDPPGLRARCLERFGHAAFEGRVSALMRAVLDAP
jgi:glycosyltransferase involved in cell wall biosynthesis